MIKNTHAKRPQDTLSAYKDNSSVVTGFKTDVFAIDPGTNGYSFKKDQLEQLMKVETHNHPTAISPYPGAATGVGGEIRDEAATGTGSRTVAGICGFMVSDLHIPGCPQPWERIYADFPTRLATPLQIMTEGPIGGAAFGNEFGRPQLCGFFRTYEGEVAGELRGYHKPIMLAGGMGVIRHSQVQKKDVTVGALIVQIGGPAMRIGLGGGAASSMMTGTNSEALDFNSVQRGNAEMQRRCQGVIDACSYLGKANPILSVHDIGAGGLSNGCPELVEATGGRFELRKVHNEEKSMNPMEIWCCEAQERYVLALKPEARDFFQTLCDRERCPVAFIGVATGDGQLVLEDSHFGDRPIDMDIKVLLGKPPRMVRDVKHVAKRHVTSHFAGVTPSDAFMRVLHLPAVADKTFLVAITDRSVTGRVARDQMVGRFQLPAADCAVTTMGYKTYNGQAMATGERSPIALLDGPASGRMAVAEAITNLAAADVGDISQIRLSANWMAPCGDPGEDAILYDTVKEVGLSFCPKLGVSIPVGKDSCSMHTVWEDSKGVQHKQVAPLSLVVSSFAPVEDVRLTLTPDLKPDPEGESSFLVFVDLAKGEMPLGATALAQVYGQLGDTHADCDATTLKHFFNAMQKIVKGGLALAYHDRSDGGVAVTLAEMAITGGRGIVAKLPDGDALQALFNEQPGAGLQVGERNLKEVLAIFKSARVDAVIAGAVLRKSRSFDVFVGERQAIKTDLTYIRRAWSETTYRMQALRDNPVTAREEYDNSLDATDPGMTFKLTYDPDEKPAKKAKEAAPRMALRLPGRPHERPHSRTRRPQGLPGPRRMRRLQLRRRPRRRVRLGAFDPLQRPPEGDVQDVLRASRHVRARSVQRLPDAIAAEGHHTRRGRVAQVREEHVRAVRGQVRHDRDRAVAVHLLQGDGGLAPSDRRCARRGTRLDRGLDARHLRRALRRRTRRGDYALSLQPERFDGRTDGVHDDRRARHDHDAAPRARLQGVPAQLQPGRLQGERSVDADVPERIRVRGVCQVTAGEGC